MLRFVTNVLTTVWLALLTAVAIYSHAPASLKNIQGLDAPPQTTVPGARQPDVRERIEQAVLNRTTPVVITEAEANRYLATILRGEEGGLSRRVSQFDRLALSFEKGYCRAWLIWKVGGGSRTASMDFTVRRGKTEYVIEPTGGHFGRLPVFRGALVALQPAFREACTVLSEDPNDLVRPIFEMNAITFERGRVILDPRLEVTR